MGTFGVRASRSLRCGPSVVSTALLVVVGLAAPGGGAAVAAPVAKSSTQTITGTVRTIIKEQGGHQGRGVSDTIKALKVGSKFVPLTDDSLTTVKDGAKGHRHGGPHHQRDQESSDEPRGLGSTR